MRATPGADAPRYAPPTSASGEDRAPLILAGARVAPGGRLLAAGPVRAGERTKLLARRLAPGEIALIDHLDIDALSAEELISARAAAVLNCSASSGGSYPNAGPSLLLDAGIPVVDLDDARLPALVRDGDPLELRLAGVGGLGPPVRVLREGHVLACGEALDRALVRLKTSERRRSMGTALERFARNTLEHMSTERELLQTGLGLPTIAVDLCERPAIVVARCSGYLRDLRALRPFVEQARPALIAVDGAADALLGEGLRADLIVGDMDSASDAALGCGSELIVHSYSDGSAPGAARVRALGLDFQLAATPGCSEDLALLLAAEAGARPIVSLCSQFGLVDLLDRCRRGAASTFLTRLRLGDLVIDARGLGLLLAGGERSEET